MRERELIKRPFNSKAYFLANEMNLNYVKSEIE